MRNALHILVLTGLGLTACNSDEPFSPPYDPALPVAWAVSVTNSFFPLLPGTTWEHRAQTDEGVETIVIEVLDSPRSVNGVSATVVRDRVFIDGELIEDTFDWYAQDVDGNVWYLGEDSKEVENGVVVGTEGSWEWGVDGALPGVIMWADPAAHLGEEYRQEYYRGEAEDWGKVVGVGETVTVPFGMFTGCIRTEDWNALDGGAGREQKSYCPGVGVALEISADGDERVELIAMTGG